MIPCEYGIAEIDVGYELNVSRKSRRPARSSPISQAPECTSAARQFLIIFRLQQMYDFARDLFPRMMEEEFVPERLACTG